MGTIADKLGKLAQTKADIKAAIAAKGQAVGDADTFASYAGKIAAIQTGVDTSDATAVAGDIASGKTAYVKGEKVTGSATLLKLIDVLFVNNSSQNISSNIWGDQSLYRITAKSEIRRFPIGATIAVLYPKSVYEEESNHLGFSRRQDSSDSYLDILVLKNADNGTPTITFS